MTAEECIKEKDKNVALVSYVKFSYKLTEFLYKHTKITGNEVSILNIFIGLFSGFLVAYGYFITMGILLYVYVILDHVDGALSRMRGTARINTPQSKMGGWLDTSGHFILLSSLLGGLGYFFNTWLYSFIIMACVFSITVMRMKFVAKGGQIKPTGKRKFIHWFMINLSKLNFHIGLIFILGIVKIGIPIYSAYLILYTSAVFFLYTYKIASGKTNN